LAGYRRASAAPDVPMLYDSLKVATSTLRKTPLLASAATSLTAGGGIPPREKLAS